MADPDRVGAVGDDGRAHSLSVVVPAALKAQLGVSADTATDGLAPTGLNVVGPEATDETFVSFDARLAVNVNRPDDAAVAEVLAGEVNSRGP